MPNGILQASSNLNTNKLVVSDFSSSSFKGIELECFQIKLTNMHVLPHLENLREISGVRSK